MDSGQSAASGGFRVKKRIQKMDRDRSCWFRIVWWQTRPKARAGDELLSEKSGNFALQAQFQQDSAGQFFD